MHVHVSPDAVPRTCDAIELAFEGRQWGMEGFVLKDHSTITADRAYLVEKAVPGVRVFGTLVLNDAVGGLNPSAVEAALALKAKMVFMPTLSADHDIRQRRHVKSQWGHWTSPQKLAGIRILKPNGSLVPEVEDILGILKGSDVILGTGHLSPEESLALVERAKGVGLSKVVVTHASNPIIGMSMTQQKRAAALGAFIEHSYLSSLKGKPIPKMVQEIHEVGAQRCILSTDLGQQGYPSPVEGLSCFIDELLQSGMNHKDICWTIRDNPRRLLDLE